MFCHREPHRKGKELIIPSHRILEDHGCLCHNGVKHVCGYPSLGNVLGDSGGWSPITEGSQIGAAMPPKDVELLERQQPLKPSLGDALERRVAPAWEQAPSGAGFHAAAPREDLKVMAMRATVWVTNFHFFNAEMALAPTFAQPHETRFEVRGESPGSVLRVFGAWITTVGLHSTVAVRDEGVQTARTQPQKTLLCLGWRRCRALGHNLPDVHRQKFPKKPIFGTLAHTSPISNGYE